jgi:S1-C subfamily serine protease
VVGSSRAFGVTLADGRRVRASLVGSFVPDDLAVIKIRASRLRAASFAGARLEVGDIVLAVGNPLGLRSSVTQGIVSALGRVVSEETGAVLPDVVQTSAPINPGNSGGALVDLNGKVVGIPTLVALNPNLGGSQAAGIGFAIPSRTVRDIASQLIEHGRVIHSHRPYLGVRLAETPGVNGVVVAAVIANGPAGKAGIRTRDVIVSLNGRRVSSFEDLAVALASLRPGQQVKVGILRPDGSRQTIAVTLGELPANVG